MSERREPMKISSAVEFYERWPNLRPRAEALARACQDTPEDADLLRWMIRVVDMVGPNDLHED